MAKVTIKIDGGETTIRAIDVFDMETKAKFIALVRDTSKQIQKTGKANAPVSKRPKSRGKSGDLRRSIRPKYFDSGLSATVVPRKPKGSHRHFVEYGTKPRRTRSGANRGKMPAIPFMGPAEQASESVYNQKARSIVDRDKNI